jgi:hypothetical protein
MSAKPLNSTVRPIRPALGRPVTPFQPPPDPGGRAAASPAALKAQTAAPARRKGPSWAPVIASVSLLLAVTVFGASYYLAPPEERVRDPLHAWLRPSGYVGQTAGILAVSIFIFLWLYPLRKKFRWLRWTGAMSKWLDVHVAAALILPVLAAVHASWRFDGVIGLGFWSMIVVCLSGVAGRYLYVHIPRSASGLELTAEEIASERRGLLEDVVRTSGLPAAQVESLLRSDPSPCDGLGLLATVRRMASDELARWRAARSLRRICATRKTGDRLDRRALRRVVKLAGREMALTQQARMLSATQRVFRLWHVAHRPFAMAALVAVLIHVGVVISMGMTWFW